MQWSDALDLFPVGALGQTQTELIVGVRRQPVSAKDLLPRPGGCFLAADIALR
jgi:hypothetical protein